jgi:putative SOS response-associated peptidase YedK
MCGRYSLTTAPEAMRRLFDLDGPGLNLEPRYNIAPTQQAPVIRRPIDAADAGREMIMMRWGLVPSWSKDGPDSRYSMINARAETVAEKPAYREAFRRRRCLVPADGFYEWQKVAGGKQPWRFTLASGDPFLFAGLWESWRKPDGSDLLSFTIVVTDANRLVSKIHDRMPVILDAANAAAWLAGETEDALLGLLQPFDDTRMVAVPVSKRVNSPANDDPGLIEPVSA